MLNSLSFKILKYNNKITIVDNIKFRSKKEAKRYCELKLLEKNKIIHNLKLQVKYDFKIEKIKICSYIADFTYNDQSGNFIVEDTKGFKTNIYKIKKKMMLAFYNINILET